ncbi:cytochrome c oxidase assembly protein [Paenibacillus senegalensis]|uniref:cytochrome c oxidase assembly protein n=1 Tax=Paenibacillus senegalensis TaxID=1465766 RepID=UPI000288C9C8|nr:cytochrome c oxidase assembly protein [Paenibacillus senegalensis]
MTNTEHVHNLNPDFFALWRPDVFLLTVLLGAVYFYLIGPGRKHFPNAKPVPFGKQAWMVSALVIFYLGQGSPLGYYGHGFLFSAHMLQMSLVYLAVPPLVYLGIPDWMTRHLLAKPGVKKWLHPITHPLIALLLFNLLFSFYHLPLIFDFLMVNHLLHNVYHFILIATALLMWFPVFIMDKYWCRISELKKLIYIFANGVLLTPACALIIFAGTELYSIYAGAPQLFTFLPPVDDQQTGGVIMKIMQEFVYGLMLAFVFFRWYNLEKKKEAELEEQGLADGTLLPKEVPSS